MRKKILLKTLSRIYKCIDIKYNTILLKNKAFQNYIYIISIFVIKYSLSYKHISRGRIRP